MSALYKPQDQEDLIKALIDTKIAELETALPKSANKEKTINELVPITVVSLYVLIPRMKDISFKAEKESRFIYTDMSEKLIPGSDKRHPVKFKTGKCMIVPYIEIPLAAKTNGTSNWGPITILDSVIIGHQLHTRNCHRGLSRKCCRRTG